MFSIVGISAFHYGCSLAELGGKPHRLGSMGIDKKADANSPSFSQ